MKFSKKKKKKEKPCPLKKKMKKKKIEGEKMTIGKEKRAFDTHK